MTQDAKEILRRIENWPQEDQEELIEVAREIEARRTGVYVLSDGERAALDEALRSSLASDEEVAAFWKRHGVA
jgi:vacuolar-type H+-ATPase subunit H